MTNRAQIIAGSGCAGAPVDKLEHEVSNGLASLVSRRTAMYASLVTLVAGALGGTSARAKPIESLARSGTMGIGSVDVHSHFLPSFYRSAVMEVGPSKLDGMPSLPAWSEQNMLASMDRLGISTAMLSISSPGVHFGDDGKARTLARAVNVEGARLRDAHPTRFGVFASLPLPDIEGALEEIGFAAKKLKVDGFIIGSNSQGVYPGDPRLDPILAELDRHSAVVMLHPTSARCSCCPGNGLTLPDPVLEFMFETTRAVSNLILMNCLNRFPHIKFIVPAGGGAIPVLADRVALAAAVMPAMTQVSRDEVMSSLRKFHYDLSGVPVPRLLDALRTLADPEKLLYGSDLPFTPEPAVTQLLNVLDRALAGEPTLHSAVFRQNAHRLFPRLAEGLS